MSYSAYIDATDYAEVYPDDTISSQAFGRLAYEASRIIDNWVTGVDGVNKLTVAYPSDDTPILFCACKLVHVLNQIMQEENRLTASSGAVSSASVGMINSVSSGSESISFKNVNSVYLAAAQDEDAKNKLLGDIVRQCLAGEIDANGVNLLYGGVYPCTLTQ